MKKVRFSITNLGGGGAEKILINILKYLPRDKFQISLFLFEKTLKISVLIKNLYQKV